MINLENKCLGFKAANTPNGKEIKTMIKAAPKTSSIVAGACFKITSRQGFRYIKEVPKSP